MWLKDVGRTFSSGAFDGSRCQHVVSELLGREHPLFWITGKSQAEVSLFQMLILKVLRGFNVD